MVPEEAQTYLLHLLRVLFHLHTPGLPTGVGQVRVTTAVLSGCHLSSWKEQRSKAEIWSNFPVSHSDLGSFSNSETTQRLFQKFRSLSVISVDSQGQL